MPTNEVEQDIDAEVAQIEQQEVEMLSDSIARILNTLGERVRARAEETGQEPDEYGALTLSEGVTMRFNVSRYDQGAGGWVTVDGSQLSELGEGWPMNSEGAEPTPRAERSRREPTGPELSAEVARRFEHSIPEVPPEYGWEYGDNVFSQTFVEPKPESTVDLVKRYLVAPFGTLIPLKIWEHAGLRCAIVRGPLGSLNGYCQLPEDHPYYNADELEPPIEVHGGITWHNDNWIGFDTGHAGDVVPITLPYRSPLAGDHLWTFEEVVHETEHMALAARTIRKIDLDSYVSTTLGRALELIDTQDLRAELERRG